jgi:hypothetical protein
MPAIEVLHPSKRGLASDSAPRVRKRGVPKTETPLRKKLNSYLSIQADSLGQPELIERKFKEKYRIKENGKFESL